MLQGNCLPWLAIWRTVLGIVQQQMLQKTGNMRGSQSIIKGKQKKKKKNEGILW